MIRMTSWCVIAALTVALTPAAADPPVEKITSKDPVSDDHGPGSYTYPTDAAYARGSFDLTEFSVNKKGDRVRFDVTVTGMQMAGVSQKEASVRVGCTPEVMRRHYERLDGMAIAGRNLERRLGQSPQLLRACYARDENTSLDVCENRTQTVAG